MPIPEELERFRKMLKYGIGPDGVRGKMILEGYTEEDFNKYINPETAQISDSEEKNVEDSSSSDENSSNMESDSDDNKNDDDDSKNDKLNTKDKTCKHNKYNFVSEPDEDLKMDNLQSIPIKKTLLIVNTFIVNTTAFLNKFVSHCETKLHEIHSNVQRMESTLLLLEGKLNSVGWLESAQKGEISNPTQSNNENNNKNDIDNDNSNNNSENENENENDSSDNIKNDPELAQWFKMYKVGVPEQAVRNKMALSGIDSDTINKVIESCQKI